MKRRNNLKKYEIFFLSSSLIILYAVLFAFDVGRFFPSFFSLANGFHQKNEEKGDKKSISSHTHTTERPTALLRQLLLPSL